MLFPLSILTPTPFSLTKVTHRDQILFLSRSLIFMTQAMTQVGKFVLLSTHLQYIHEILNRMVKVDTLSLQRIYVIIIVPEKRPSQTQTLSPHTNFCNIYIKVESHPSSTIEINDPTSKKIPQNETGESSGDIRNLRSNPIPNYAEIYRY